MSLHTDRWGLVAVVAAASLAGGTVHDRPAAPSPPAIILATTTSTQDSGLLDSLVPLFTARTGIAVKVIAVGTGAALDMAARGNADAVLVHAPPAERRYVASGDLVAGRLIMHNDFLVVGPVSDPARVKGGMRAVDAMRAIARSARFVSRGDGSGTEQMERALWTAASLDLASIAGREQTGQGMAATLTIADQHGAYTLTDRATYLALRPRLALVPLVQGDPALLNVYHAYVVNPARHPATRSREAERFVSFLASPEAQRLIAAFGTARFGEPLFFADAGKPEPAPAPPTP
ncbi:MAG: substrate-binding domain-containing protein [Gemmatimonadaceae bacterium]